MVPVINPFPASAVVGDRRGLFERDAHALGDGVHHAPGSRRHARRFLRQDVAEALAARPIATGRQHRLGAATMEMGEVRRSAAGVGVPIQGACLSISSRKYR